MLSLNPISTFDLGHASGYGDEITHKRSGMMTGHGHVKNQFPEDAIRNEYKDEKDDMEGQHRNIEYKDGLPCIHVVQTYRIRVVQSMRTYREAHY